MGISVFAINLTTRSDRRKHIKEQFHKRDEFNLEIFNAKTSENPANGLWESLRGVISVAKNRSLEYVIVCEDDHEFTSEYSYEKLDSAINFSVDNQIQIILGGPSWVDNFFCIRQDVFFVNKFTGLQFAVIFKNAYDIVLNAVFETNDVADLKLSILLDRKIFLFPYLSVQRDFGYSDVTIANNTPGKITTLYDDVIDRVAYFFKRQLFFSQILSQNTPQERSRTGQISITTFAVCSSYEDVTKIKEIFKNTPEFDLNYFMDERYCRTAGISTAAFISVIMEANKRGEDVVLICDGSHEFTDCYRSNLLHSYIVNSYLNGAEMLFGGQPEIDYSLPVSNGRFWFHSVTSSHFTVIYKSIFKAILESRADTSIPLTKFLTDVSDRKFLIVPFISVSTRSNSKFDNFSISRRFAIDRFKLACNKLEEFNQYYRSYFPTTDEVAVIE